MNYMNKKKIFITTILSLACIFNVLSVDKAEARKWVCIYDDECQTIEATDQTQASSACNAIAGTSHVVYDASTCPAKKTPISTDPNMVKLENPLSSGTDVSSIISIVIKTALSIIGALTLLMLVWGGFQWLTSAGNPEKVKMGTQTMVWAIIGVVLVFASYILLSTFTSYLTGGTT